MIIDKLHSLLERKDFKQVAYLDEINLLGLLYYKSEEKNVFIYTIKKNDNFYSDIANVSSKLREVLKNNEINIWNSYMIICIEIEKFDKEIMLIERDSKYLRKYIVKDEFDMERIYFLDTNYKTVNDKNEHQNIISVPKDIEYIMDKMKDEEGNIRKIDSKEIDGIVRYILRQIGEKYEN